jgi:aspartyl-tRNA(Asn)/glutamyl-tRNA(Gln) amidotransferase subunit C
MSKQTSPEKITDKTTTKVADLIKINIPESEIATYTEQLSTVLDSVTVLNELDTEKIETTSQTHGLVNVLREDEAEPGLDMDKYKNDRNFKKGYFVVDKVID